MSPKITDTTIDGMVHQAGFVERAGFSETAIQLLPF